MFDLKTVVIRKKFQALREVFRLMCDEPYAVVKGEALSLQAYGKTGMRHAGDIDVLISHSNSRKIAEYLESDGFITKNISRDKKISVLIYSHQILPYTKKIYSYGSVAVDVNYDIFWGEYEGKRINIDDFLAGAVKKDIYGITVKTLPPLEAMVQLALHHYRDMNSIFLLATRKSIKYDMFSDIYFLIKNNSNDITIDRLYAMSVKYEIVPYIYYVLYYTGIVFHDEMISKYLSVFRTREGDELLECYGLCEKERKKWRYDFKTRLETPSMYDLIKEDLTEDDKVKIEYNRQIF